MYVYLYGYVNVGVMDVTIAEQSWDGILKFIEVELRAGRRVTLPGLGEFHKAADKTVSFTASKELGKSVQ